MSSISGVQNDYYSQIASGNKLQGASDDAAGMAVLQKEESQIRGYDAGTRNAQDGSSLLRISDAGLESIGDSLSRIRELAVKASNSAILSNSDLQSIQEEIEQLKQDISDTAANTQYNTKTLLDGSDEDGIYIATGSDGSGTTLNIGDATLEALGIADFDVTKQFSIQTIDDAISKVSENRSSVGAQSNALDSAIGYNMYTSYNLTEAMSGKGDTDVEETVMEMQKNQVLQTYRFMMQKDQEEEEQKKLSLFYM